MFFRAKSDILERTQVAKLLMLQDQGQISEFQNQSLEKIQFEEFHSHPKSSLFSSRISFYLTCAEWYIKCVNKTMITMHVLDGKKIRSYVFC